MSILFKAIIVYAGLTFAWGFSFMPEGTNIVFDRFDGMCGPRNIPVKSLFRVINAVKNIMYLNATTTIREDVNDKLEINIKMRRCRTKENLDTCEDYTEEKGLSYCPLIDPTIARLSPMYINFVPTIKCPFKKGVYKAINSKLDLSVFTGFPMDAYYWRAKVNITTMKTKSMVQCLEVDVYTRKSSKT